MHLILPRRDGAARPSFPHNLRVVLAFVCILLVLLTGTAQVLHQHTAGEVQNPNCSLCAVAHLAVEAAPMVVQALVAADVVLVVRPPLLDAPPDRAFSFHLYIRPPPATVVTAHA